MTSGTVVTFYSYKGGVGRSLLLANTATWLARVGFRILAVDWDLEAPGLFHFFDQAGLLGRQPRTGVVDLLLGRIEGRTTDWRQIVRRVAVPDAQGLLDFLDAGNGQSADYGTKLNQLAWEKYYQDPAIALGQKLEALRREWTEQYDFVFIDSRTGLTDSGGICTIQLPDIVVFVLAPTVQGLDGCLQVVEKARERRSLLPLDRGGFLSVPVLSRFDPNAAGDLPEKWLRIFAERLEPLYDEWREQGIAAGQLAKVLRLSYAPRWSMGEPLCILEEDLEDSSNLSHGIANVAALLAHRLRGNLRLHTERSAYVRDVQQHNRALLHESPADKAFAYDLFLSYSSAQRDYARDLAAFLEQQRRRVFFDEKDLVPGRNWVESLGKALKDARGLVTLLPAEPKSWQWAELEAFLEHTARDTTRFVIPVFEAEMAAMPAALKSVHALHRRSKSPAELAEELHTHIRRLEQPATAGPERRRGSELPTWTEPAAEQAYRTWLIQQHERLLPYFTGASDYLLEEVCVRVELAPANKAHSKHMQRPEFMEEGGKSSAATTLEELLLPAQSAGQPVRWVVQGEAGAGKTTLARSLALSKARTGPVLPIFLPLARLQAPELDPIAFAVADMLGEKLAQGQNALVLASVLRRAESSGQLLLLLDGLDEVEPAWIDRLLAAIVQYARDHERVVIALSGRPIAFERRELPEAFGRTSVLPLRTEEQEKLLLKLLGPTEAAAVRKHLDRHRALAELASSPLLLTLLAVVARDSVLAEGTLPADRCRLYKMALDLFLRRGFGIEKKGVRDPGPARRILQRLSWRLHELGGEAWTEDALSEELSALRMADKEVNFLVKETWSTNDAFLKDISTNAGILGPQESPHMPWRYLHRSLREFLAAEDLARRPLAEVEGFLSQWKQALDTHENVREAEEEQQPSDAPDPARWGEVVALVCGLVPRPEQILEALGKQSVQLTVRTLSAVDAMTPADIVRFLGTLEGWSTEDLFGLLDLWGLDGSQTVQALEALTVPGASTAHLAAAWAGFERAGAILDRRQFRERFFEKCGRPLPQTEQLEWADLPGGSFSMGSKDSSYDDERPAHVVSLAPFQLAKTVVTRERFRAFDPSFSFHRPADSQESDDGDLPATDINWWEAQLFCAWLGARLPSEAEWEYACRAGTTTDYSFGDDPTQLGKYGWYFINSGKRKLATNTSWDSGKVDGEWGCHVHPVAQKPANPFGLYDMHGNVWEWCEDGWRDNYEGAPSDGSAWVDKASGVRVIRGGSSWLTAEIARSAFRLRNHPSYRWLSVGFRPARSSQLDNFTTLPSGE